MIFGLDYAWGRPSIASMTAAGVKYAARYLSHDTSGKNLTRSEADKLAKAGIWCVVVWETTASRAKTGGRAGGVADAKTAVGQAKLCGMPDSRPIYFAVDYDAPRADWPKIKAYFQGVISVLGVERVGMYGGYDPIRWGFEDGLIKWGWQTYAWSEGRWVAAAQLRQYKNNQRVGGIDCDFNHATVADYGQWMPGKLPVNPPKPEPTDIPPFPDRLITQPPAMSGTDVRVWQTQMKKRGWNITVDGVFGPESERVLRAFQADKNMVVDGVLGPVSWRAAWAAPI
jgi:hypothetical protein